MEEQMVVAFDEGYMTCIGDIEQIINDEMDKRPNSIRGAVNALNGVINLIYEAKAAKEARLEEDADEEDQIVVLIVKQQE